MSRKQLLAYFEQERQDWLSAGMSEADIYRIHFDIENENGRGGDYRIWLDERKRSRPDHKYAPGTPIAIDTADPESAWISGGRNGLDDVESGIDLEAALLKLTELQRFCFAEVALNKRTQQSVADELRIKQQVVDRHVKTAKNKLKKFLRIGCKTSFPTAIKCKAMIDGFEKYRGSRSGHIHNPSTSGLRG